jgi:hypothetical protein
MARKNVRPHQMDNKRWKIFKNEQYEKILQRNHPKEITLDEIHNDFINGKYGTQEEYEICQQDCQPDYKY